MIGLAVAAVAIAAQPPAACSFYGWSADTDPRGLNVRAAPSLAAAVVGRLPPAIISDTGDSYAPDFDIVGARSGWLRIRGAHDSYKPGRPRPTFAGSGWIHGSKARVAVQSGVGHDGPDAGSPVSVDFGDWLGESGGEVRGISDCRGKWAKIGYAVPGKRPAKGPPSGEAWFTGLCGNQRTTCEQSADEPGLPAGHR